MQLVLSLFPGIGLLDMAFEEAGFCIVRGPDLLWGGDIHAFHPPAGRFDGIIGGPPCQHWSSLAHINRARGHRVADDLIPEFLRCLIEAQPRWFLMENVTGAPEPVVAGYATHSLLLNNRWFGGEQHRQRRMTFGLRGVVAVDLWRHLEIVALESPEWAYAVSAAGSFPPGQRDAQQKRARLHDKNGPSWATVADALRLQGLPADFLERFTEHTPLTARGAQRLIGNGVPLLLGRAVAQAVRAALAELAQEEVVR